MIGSRNAVAPYGGAAGETPLVSVIMIFLDAGRYIAEAVESVREQTFSDWELILVDDGSTDEGLDVARRFAESEPLRIVCVHHDGRVNRGTGPSRSLGLSLARGRYIAFLDADDVYHRERLARHVAELERDSDLVMVQSLLVYWHSWSGQGAEGDVDEPAVLAGGHTVVRPPGMLLLTLATAGAVVPGICSVTARADAVRRIGGFESEFQGVYEDQVLWMKLYLDGDVLCLNERLAWYRQHPESLTHRAYRAGEYTPGRPHECRAQLFRWLRGYLSRQPESWPEIEGWVQRELRPYEEPYSFRLRDVPWQTLTGLRSLSSRVLPGPVHRRLLDGWGRRKNRRVERQVREAAARVLRDYRRPDGSRRIPGTPPERGPMNSEGESGNPSGAFPLSNGERRSAGGRP